MKYTTLPNTDLNVSKICLGTMTYGNQNTESEAHQQLDFALEKGVNFVDTAEMYAIPASPDTQGLTETYIGSWLKASQKRKEIVLASKITGPARGFEHIRKELDFSKKSLEDALHKSLQRLQTDYLDLYQLHWPERSVNIFGVREYDHTQNTQWQDNFNDVLDRLERFVKEGKVRHIGLSNETPYGVMKYMEAHRTNKKRKMISVQNAYCLLQRRDEIALSEVLQMENVGYLAYSPLGFGMLSGKYLNGKKPENARVTLYPRYSRYSSESSFRATEAYNNIAKKHGLTLAQLSLAFVNQQSFVTSTIIGATTLQQLEENIASINVQLSEEILKEIQSVHEKIPNPAA
ncbi:NADP(H)-dependent aldo-keto reductase [Jejudonia soesokkakensis]|uniref:NADP(H)-dependent aldo-keto reductase n=1 Tax=Jejudonia soesokkakensis TaxID=1323432 RepID=A0ABW2MS90_9FLAO